jgi:hypothetical protein
MSRSSSQEPLIKRCQCSVCDAEFQADSCDVIETVTKVVSHWNEDHSDILKNSYTPYRETERETKELEDGAFKIQRRKHYLAVYDVLNTEGDTLLDETFVKNTLLNEFCEDCHTPVEQLDDFEELENQDGPVAKYLCRQCRKNRNIQRRKANNRQLSAFERM